MKGRLFLLLCSVSVTAAIAAPARAGTYLDTVALLLDESKRSGDFVQTHFPDKQLAVIAHQLAEARVKTGRAVMVPRDVEKAHPHLLLSLEAMERAMAAAEDQEGERFLKLIAQAREEESNYRALLGQQRLTVPDLEKCRRE
jgi:hypothetical protein